MKQVPVRLLLLPPVIAAGTVGVGFTLIAIGWSVSTGVPYYAILYLSGTGVMLGFLWGSIVWSERLAKTYHPRRYETTVSTKENTANRKPVEIYLTSGSHAFPKGEIIVLPKEIEISQLVETGKLLVSNGYSFATSISGSGMPLSRPQYEALRDLLIAKGLAKWKSEKSHQLGCELTTPGKALFKQLATHQEGLLPRIIKSLE